MNIVEFALKFKDMASAPLQQFGNSARQAFSIAENYTNNLINQNRQLAHSYDNVRASAQNAQDAAKGFSVVDMIKGNLMSGGIQQALGSAVDFVKDSISAGMERQQLQTSFNVLTGSDASGQALTKQLVDLQKNTILGSEVFQNAQTMLGFGFKDTEVLDNLKMLGDVSMGDAGKLQSLTLAFSQIRAAGKLTGQDLLQLINAGFNPLEQMAQRTGKSVGQLKEEMSQGNISFKDVQQAFQDATSEGGKFNNMLETIAETPAGKMAQLSGAWDEFKINAGQAFMPLVSMAMDLANKLLPLAENLLTPITNGVQQLIEWVKSLTSETGGFADYWTTISDVFMNGVVPYAQMLWEYIKDIVGKVVEFVRTSELLKDIFWFIGEIIKGMYSLLRGIITALKNLFDKVILPIWEAIESAYRLIKGVPQKSQVQVATARSTEEKREAQENSDVIKSIAKSTLETSKGVNNTEKATTSGGPKIINITVQKFMDALNIITNSLSEGEKEIEDKFNELFARVLLGGATG